MPVAGWEVPRRIQSGVGPLDGPGSNLPRRRFLRAPIGSVRPDRVVAGAELELVQEWPRPLWTGCRMPERVGPNSPLFSIARSNIQVPSHGIEMLSLPSRGMAIVLSSTHSISNRIKFDCIKYVIQKFLNS